MHYPFSPVWPRLCGSVGRIGAVWPWSRTRPPSAVTVSTQSVCASMRDSTAQHPRTARKAVPVQYSRYTGTASPCGHESMSLRSVRTVHTLEDVLVTYSPVLSSSRFAPPSVLLSSPLLSFSSPLGTSVPPTMAGPKKKVAKAGKAASFQTTLDFSRAKPTTSPRTSSARPGSSAAFASDFRAREFPGGSSETAIVSGDSDDDDDPAGAGAGAGAAAAAAAAVATVATADKAASGPAFIWGLDLWLLVISKADPDLLPTLSRVSKQLQALVKQHTDTLPANADHFDGARDEEEDKGDLSSVSMGCRLR